MALCFEVGIKSRFHQRNSVSLLTALTTLDIGKASFRSRLVYPIDQMRTALRTRSACFGKALGLPVDSVKGLYTLAQLSIIDSFDRKHRDLALAEVIVRLFADLSKQIDDNRKRLCNRLPRLVVTYLRVQVLHVISNPIQLGK